MLSAKEFKIVKKSVEHMHAIWNTDGSGKHDEYVKKAAVLDLLEEFTSDGRVDLTVDNFASEFKKALDEHENKRSTT